MKGDIILGYGLGVLLTSVVWSKEIPDSYIGILISITHILFGIIINIIQLKKE